jgi:hypothetical protein
MSDTDQHAPQNETVETGNPAQSGDQEGVELHDPSYYASEEAAQGAIVTPAPRGKLGTPVVFGGFAVLVLVILGLFLMKGTKPPAQPEGDLGPGIYAAAGLRGHLVTKWEGDTKTGKPQYQLRIEPMEPQQVSGFAFVNARPPAPLSANIRLLDSTGFALCGKEIVFHYDPKGYASQSTPTPPANKAEAARIAAAQIARESELLQQKEQEVQRESGKDIFENQTDADGRITAISVQGYLPCSVDAYRRADYWDFTTNFPTLDEQNALLDPKSAQALRHDADPNEPQTAPRRKVAKKLVSAFYIQGDDRVTGYDPSRGLLEAGAGRSFVVDRSSAPGIANEWAANSTLIHYKCDQQANCALTNAGGLHPVRARMN